MDTSKNNFKDNCVICLSRRKRMKAIFDSGDDIVDRILFCTGVRFTRNANLPSQICNKCLQQLTVAHKFKTQCLLAENTFERFLCPIIKTEEDLKHDNYQHEILNEEDQIKREVYEECESVDLINGFNDLEYEMKFDIEAKPDIDNGAFGDPNSISDTDEVLPEVTSKHTKKQNVPGRKRGPYKKSIKIQIPGNCLKCDLRFDTVIEEKLHKAQHHKRIDSLVCEICGQVMEDKSRMYYHQKMHTQRYCCEHCDYATGVKSGLIKHMHIHMGEKNYKCQYCGKAFRTASTRSVHVRAIHLNERKYSCSLCNKMFFARTKLLRHIDSHNNIKRYECEVCHSHFTRRCYWKMHLKQNHDIVIPRMKGGRRATYLFNELVNK